MLIKNLVRKNKNINLCLVLAIVGNESHNYKLEEVTREEGKKFAEENDAIFMLVSSKFGEGITELFNSIGKKFLKQYEIIEQKLLKEKLKYLKEQFKNKLNNKLMKYIDY